MRKFFKEKYKENKDYLVIFVIWCILGTYTYFTMSADDYRTLSEFQIFLIKIGYCGIVEAFGLMTLIIICCLWEKFFSIS